MTDSLIPLPTDAIYWRDQLFNLIAPVTMTAEKFDEIWPFVSCVYTHRKTETRFNNSLKVSQYECRLKKSRKSSSSSQSSPAAVDSPTESTIKRRPGNTIKKAGICNVSMKVSRQMSPTPSDLAGSDSKTLTVTIERIGKGNPSDYSCHTHDIEESFRYKRPEVLRNIARAEREKNYSAAQVINALRGVGTAEGSDRLVLVGGASMTR